MNFIKEAIKLGLVMFAGQLVFEGLNKVLSHARRSCADNNCCHHNITEKKEEKKASKRKTR